MENFFELIAKRESCRNYDETRPVEHEKLVRCLEAARLSPSACNSQPWHFTAVENRETAAQVAACLQSAGMNKFASKAPAFVVITEEKATLKATIAAVMKSQAYAQIDVGLATAHLCLAATEQGLSTCIIGWFSEDKLKDLLGISKAKRIRLVVAVGYAADDKLREKKRKPLEEIATFAD